MDKQKITSEQLSFYKLFTVKNYSIEIPIIQRDFAQGRKTVKSIRTDFLDTLYNYLQEGIPFRDLDFIYGHVDEKNNLIPLDGQQRLTTLFLLHWYLSHRENAYESFKNAISIDGNSRFRYKIRQSSLDFCNALVKNGIDLKHLNDPDIYKDNSLSKTIRDSPWYYLSWDKDPTIQSMLTMLDAINQKFNNSIGFYSKLINPELPVITFHYIPLMYFGLTDDLYIKMNSRGKPLSRFEVFKARFEQQLEDPSQFTKKYLLNINGNEKEIDTKTYFSHKIDTQWTDLFWIFKVKKERKEGNIIAIYYDIDGLMMNYISTLAINQIALAQNEVRYYIDNQSTIQIGLLTSLDKDFAYTLIETLDFLSSGTKLNALPEDYYYYNELESFKSIINKSYSDAGYLERIRFYAYYAFLVQWKGNCDGFQDWMRVVVNLSENTMPYNNDTEFINSIRSINSLLTFSNKILEYLTTKQSISIKGFNSTQIKEERIKAHLININDEWNESILKYERHEYFKGQLTFALAFSGIESYFDAENDCNWQFELNQNFKVLFDTYISKVFALFNGNGLRDEILERHLLHRALLSKGDYLLYAKSNYSFLIDKERDVSWKRLLQGDGERKENREFFKQVIDDQYFNQFDFESIEQIARSYDPSIEQWRIKFIQYPEVFTYFGRFKYIRYRDDETLYLLKGIRMSGEHAELFSLSLYYELKKEIFFDSPAPFEKLKYYMPTGENEEPCAFLDNWKYKRNNFAIDIFYIRDNQYELKFFDRNRKEIPVEIVNLLLQLDFIEEDNFLTTISSEFKLKKILISICTSLVNISDA
jgi:hypothetical protein